MKNNPFGPWIFSTRNEDSKGWGNKLAVKFVDVILAKKFHEITVQRKELEREVLKKASIQRQSQIKSRL